MRRVRLSLYDVQGREVAVLANGMRESGRYTAALNATALEPGLYFPGEFGVRSEVDMIALPGKAEVTGRVQTELVRV